MVRLWLTVFQCLRHGERGNAENRELVGSEVDKAQVVLVQEGVVPDVTDPVVLDQDGLEAGQKGEHPEGLDSVPAGVQILKLEAILQAVVVFHAVNLVVVDVKTAEGVWHEGIVEPVQLVGGDVEVLQVHLGGEQPVDVLHLILRQVEVGQVGQGSKAALVERLQSVLGQVEEVQAWCLVEGGRVNLRDVIAAQVEEGELLQPLDVLPPNGPNYVDAGVKVDEVGQVGQRVRKVGEKIPAHLQIPQLGQVSVEGQMRGDDQKEGREGDLPEYVVVKRLQLVVVQQ